MAEEIERDGVPLEVLWTVHRYADRSPEFYVHYIPCYPEQQLRDLLRGSGPDRPVHEFGSDAVVAAEMLWGEIRPRTLPMPVFPTEAGIVAARATEHLSRRVTPTWVGLPADTSVVAWNRELVLGEQPVPSPGAVSVEIASLSAAGRGAVDVLDGLAVETAYRRHVVAVGQLAGGSVPQPPPPQKYRVFVSYRKPQITTAKTLYATVAVYGNHAHFAPFLDEHDLRLGSWAEQLEGEVTRSLLFLPLVTPDYGIDGSFSKRELDLALQGQEQGTMHIAPVVMGPDRPPAWERLSHLHAHLVDSADELVPTSPEFQRYLRTCLASLARTLVRPMEPLGRVTRE